MRLKDENKRSAIYRAAMEVITEDGLAAASMSKIASRAGVSASTIYVYFENKEDMLNKLYLMMKEESGAVVFKGIGERHSVKEALGIFMKNLFHFMIKNPVHFSFHEQFFRSPGISAKAREEGNQCYGPLFDLYERAKSEKAVKDYPIPLMAAFVFAPIMDLVHAHRNRELKVDDRLLGRVIEMTWAAIRS